MASRLPVYTEVTELLNENPDYIDTICVDDLKPIDQLADAGKVKLTPIAATKIKARVRPLQPKPTQDQPPKPQDQQPKPQDQQPKPPQDQQPKPPHDQPKLSDIPESCLHDHDIEALNKNHTLATSMSTEKLLSILKWSDTHYYDLHLSTNLLTDKVYDYVKRVYGQRVNGTNDKRETMKSVSSETGVGIKPTRGRDAKLPISLRSLDNLYMGEGDVAKWALNQPGPYHLSAKMDGTSALYSGGVLYTRGDATVGRNISHVIPFLKLPQVPYSVRGEIVIDNAVFNQKYKDKPSRGVGGQVRKNNRNSVAGALGSINNIDEGFLADLSFLAYEIITDGSGMQTRPSEQFKRLTDDGFQVAYHVTTSEVSDEILSDLYHHLIEEYNFEVDGVVIRTDAPYIRETDKNPNYAKAYKEALANDVAVTRVVAMEWNVSQYGYLVPTVVYEPVNIGGVTLQRATGHNAREVQKLGLGTGALIEVIYRAKVNPQVNRVIEPVEPEMPKVPYVWVNGNGSNDAVNIAFKSGSNAETATQINVKRVHKFLTEIGAKGIGETTIEKIFSASGYKTVGDFINIKIEDVTFLGKQTSQNIVTSIKEAMDKVDLPTLMASSKVFGRGLGTKKFTKVFKQFPTFAETRYSYQEYVELFKQVDGFADKTSTLAAQGMVDFWEFVDSQLSDDIYKRIIDNTSVDEDHPPSALPGQRGDAVFPQLYGKNIYLTGTRDPEVILLIKKQGAVMQSGFTSNTHILVKKSSSYTNTKTEEALAREIPVYTVDEFKSKFG